MTGAERMALRHAIDTERRTRMFTLDARGRQTLRPQYRDGHGGHIAHGTSWAYRRHRCRCGPCSLAHSSEQKVYRLNRKTAAA